MIFVWYFVMVFIWILCLNHFKLKYKYFQTGKPAVVLEISKYVGSFLLANELNVDEHLMKLIGA